jgi:hypothetical protein
MPSQLANCSWHKDHDQDWIPGSHNISRPGAAAAECQETLYYGGVTAQPTSWDDWHHLVAALVQHAVDKYGMEEIRNEWAFEVRTHAELHAASSKHWPSAPALASSCCRHHLTLAEPRLSLGNRYGMKCARTLSCTLPPPSIGLLHLP